MLFLPCSPAPPAKSADGSAVTSDHLTLTAEPSEESSPKPPAADSVSMVSPFCTAAVGLKVYFSKLRTFLTVRSLAVTERVLPAICASLLPRTAA